MKENFEIEAPGAAPSSGGGGRGRVFSTDNYVAQPGPDRGNRKGAGAPKGNRNSFRHGNRSAEVRAEMHAFRLAVRLALARFELDLRTARAELAPPPDGGGGVAAEAARVCQASDNWSGLFGEERAKRRRAGATP
jgi:hypothetical protein